MNQINQVSHQELFVDIFNQMEILFGDQDHFPLDFFLEASRRFPDFIQTVHNS